MIGPIRFSAVTISDNLAGKVQNVRDLRDNRTYTYSNYEINLQSHPVTALLKDNKGNVVLKVPVRQDQKGGVLKYVADVLDRISGQN